MTQLKAEALEDRTNPSGGFNPGAPVEYVWDYYGTSAGDAAVGDNWVGDVAPPANWAKIKIPAGTGPISETHLVLVDKLTIEPEWGQVFGTNGMTTLDVLVESGTFQAYDGPLVFDFKGTFRPRTGDPIVFDNTWGGDIDFTPHDSMVGPDMTFDGTLAGGSDFGYRGELEFFSGDEENRADVLWKSVGWIYAWGGGSIPYSSISAGGTDFGFTVDGQSFLSGGDLFSVGGASTSEFLLTDGSTLQVEQPTVFYGGANAVIGKGAVLNATGYQSVEVYPGVYQDVSVLVEGAGTNLSLYGNLSRIVGGKTVAVLGTGTDAGIRLFDSGIAGADRYKSVIVGSLVLVGSDLQFSDTAAHGIFHVTDSWVARGASVFARADLDAGVSDLILSSVIDLGTTTSLSVLVGGSYTGARQLEFLDSDNSLSGSFGSVDWNGFGRASLSVAAGDVGISVTAV